MTTVGFIGSGQIGGTVASLAVDAGHNVVLSNSRGPETLAELAAELGPLARAATREEAAASWWSRSRSRPILTCPPRPWRARS
jgi:predicted dinucleotide-binding enzyme